MKVNKELMLNTIFKNYTEIINIADMLDARIKYKAVNSYCSDPFRSCEEVANKICELMERKNILKNLIHIVDEAIKNLPTVQQDIFDLRYKKKLKIEAIAQISELSKQATFRHVQALPKTICKALASNAFFNAFCQNGYNKIAFIANAYYRNEGRAQKVA